MRFKPLQFLFLILIAATPALNSPIYGRDKEPADTAHLAVHEFRLSTESEAAASFTASAPGTSWGKTGAEAAILTCYLDDQYNQDVIRLMSYPNRRRELRSIAIQ